MNHSLEYIDLCGPEPDTSDHTDLQRWDKWNAWHRRFSKHFPGSNGIITENGRVVYHVLLKSQITRARREGRANAMSIKPPPNTSPLPSASLRLGSGLDEPNMPTKMTHTCPCGNPVRVDGAAPTGFPFGPPDASLAYHYRCAERLGVPRPPNTVLHGERRDIRDIPVQDGDT